MAAIASKSVQGRFLLRLRSHRDHVLHSGQTTAAPLRPIISPLRTPSITTEPCSNLSSLQSRIRRVAVHLHSLMPMHSATAAACLVSRLSSDLTPSFEGKRKELCTRSIPNKKKEVKIPIVKAE
eukprot:Gb_09547 [translate_table: standard]